MIIPQGISEIEIVDTLGKNGTRFKAHEKVTQTLVAFISFYWNHSKKLLRFLLRESLSRAIYFILSYRLHYNQGSSHGILHQP